MHEPLLYAVEGLVISALRRYDASVPSSVSLRLENGLASILEVLN